MSNPRVAETLEETAITRVTACRLALENNVELFPIFLSAVKSDITLNLSDENFYRLLCSVMLDCHKFKYYAFCSIVKKVAENSLSKEDLSYFKILSDSCSTDFKVEETPPQTINTHPHFAHSFFPPLTPEGQAAIIKNTRADEAQINHSH